MKSFPLTAINYNDRVQVGDVIYPVRYENDSAVWYRFHSKPGRTNMSGEVRVSGWLGNSYGQDAQALGEYRVIAIVGDQLRCEQLDRQD
jgi:hypothetical protein